MLTTYRCHAFNVMLLPRLLSPLPVGVEGQEECLLEADEVGHMASWKLVSSVIPTVTFISTHNIHTAV